MARTFYIDFEDGSDSNNGTSKLTPWKRVKGMVGCSGTANGITITAGDTFIFKGGVSWTGCFPWTLSGGSGVARVIYTTDRTWYNGGSFSRPVFDGEHFDPYPDNMVDLPSGGYLTINDLEFIDVGTAETQNTSKCMALVNSHDVSITNCVFACECWITIYFVFSSSGSYANFVWTGNDFSHTGTAIVFAGDQPNTLKSNIVYNNNTFHDFSSQLGGYDFNDSGVHGDGAFHHYQSPFDNTSSFTSDFQFINNKLYGDFRRSFGDDGGMTAGIYITEGLSGIIAGNDFSYDPGGDGILNQFESIIQFHQDWVHNCEIKIYNNTIACKGINAVSGGILIRAAGPESVFILRNNIVSDPQFGAFDFEDEASAATIDSDYNILHTKTGYQIKDGFISDEDWQGDGHDEHGLFIDPLLVDAPDDNTLDDDSPALLAGINLASEGYDALNEGRPGEDQGPWDMGAYHRSPFEEEEEEEDEDEDPEDDDEEINPSILGYQKVTILAQFIGDGSTTAFTYPASPGPGSDLLVVEVQGQPVAYTQSGQTLTLGAAPAAHTIVSIKATSEAAAYKTLFTAGVQTPTSQAVSVNTLGGNTATYLRTANGATSQVAGVVPAMIAVAIVKCVTTFATGDGAKPTFTIGVTGAATSLAGTTDFSGMTAGDVKVFTGAVATTKEVIVTAVAATGATSTGAINVTILMFPAVS